MTKTHQDLPVWMMAAAPLVWLPGAFGPYVHPKAAVVALAFLLGTLSLGRGRLPRFLVVTLIAGAIVFAIAALQSTSPQAALLGRWPRYEGIPILLTYFGALWLGARTGRTRTLTPAFAVSSLVLTTFSVVEILRFPGSRLGSVVGNSTDQGLLAVMFFALTVGNRSPLALAGSGAALVTVGVSGSRSAWIGVVVVLLVHAMLRPNWRKQALAVFAGAAALAVLLPQTRERIFFGHTVTGRRILWSESLEMIRDHPLFGVGPSGFVDMIGRYHSQLWLEKVGTANPPDSPHSLPLQLAVAGGVPLLLVGIVLAGFILWQGFKRASADPQILGVLAAVTAAGVVLLTNFTIVSTTTVLAFLAGVLISETTPAPETRPVWPTVIGATALTLAMVSASLAEIPLRQGIETVDTEKFELANKLRPLDADISMIAAQPLAAEGFPDAEDFARASLAVTPETYQSLAALGAILVQEDRFEEALEVLDKAVEVEPFQSAALIQRAFARYFLGDEEGAVQDLEFAQLLDPDDPTASEILQELST